jgi:hypothetical protein
MLTLQSMREGVQRSHFHQTFWPQIPTVNETYWWILTFSFCEVAPRRA